MTHDVLERVRLIRARHHADLIRADPALIERAVKSVEDSISAGRYTVGLRLWRELLRCDLEVVISKMLAENSEGQLLRSDSPFHLMISFTDVDERKMLWRQAKAEVGALCNTPKKSK